MTESKHYPETTNTDSAVQVATTNDESASQMPQDSVISYAHGGGSTEIATSSEDAIARCPMLGSLPVEQANVLLMLSTQGKELAKNHKPVIDAKNVATEKVYENPKTKASRIAEPKNLFTEQHQPAAVEAITTVKIEEKLNLPLANKPAKNAQEASSPANVSNRDHLKRKSTEDYSDSEDSATLANYLHTDPINTTYAQVSQSRKHKNAIVRKPKKSFTAKIKHDQNNDINDTKILPALIDLTIQPTRILHDDSAKSISRGLSRPSTTLENNNIPRLAPSIPEVAFIPTTPKLIISKESETNDYQLELPTDETIYSTESSLPTNDEFVATVINADITELSTQQNNSAELIFTYLHLLNQTANNDQEDDYEALQHNTSFRDNLDLFMQDFVYKEVDEPSILFTDIVQTSSQQTYSDTLLKTALYLDQTVPEDVQNQQPELFAVLVDFAQLFDEIVDSDQHDLVTLNMVEQIINAFVLLGIEDPHGAIVELTNVQGLDFLLDCMKFFSTRVVEKLGQELTPAAAINPGVVIAESNNIIKQLGRLLTVHFDVSQSRHLAWNV